MRNYLILVGFYALFILPSCSPVKGYSGPDRPDTEISIVTTDNEGGVDVNSENISGVAPGWSGVALLPGQQEYTGRADIGGELYDCRPYSEFDSYGFYDCQKEQAKKDYYSTCDCFEYMSIYQNCAQLVKTGMCRASFKTVAGQKYEITVGLNAGSPGVRVVNANTKELVKYGRCDKSSENVVRVNDYVGKGRYYANQYGFYSCY